MGRRHEPNVVAQGVQFGGICEEMKGSSRPVPTRAARRRRGIENRKAAPPDPKERTVLKFALVRSSEWSANLTDSTEDDLVNLCYRVSHTLSLSISCPATRHVTNRRHHCAEAAVTGGHDLGSTVSTATDGLEMT